MHKADPQEGEAKLDAELKRRRAIVGALSEELQHIYGARLGNVIVYGSTARGEATSGSDIDVLVVLDRIDGLGSEIRRISEPASRLSLEHDVVISTIPVSKEKWESSHLPLIATVRREGVPI